MASFTTTARVKRLLGIPTSVTTHDDVIDDLVLFVDQQILDEIGLLDCAVISYTQVLDVEPGRNELPLERTPVQAITSLVDDDDVLVEGTDFYFDSIGYVRTIGGSFFTNGRQTVTVIYTAGFPTVPEDLKHAATLMATHQFNTAPKAGLESERIGRYAYKVAGTGSGGGGSRIDPTVDRILTKYRRVFQTGN